MLDGVVWVMVSVLAGRGSNCVLYLEAETKCVEFSRISSNASCQVPPKRFLV